MQENETINMKTPHIFKENQLWNRKGTGPK